MRIISGIYGGRTLISPKDDSVRPTSDKVRGAMFNMIGSRMTMDGARVLDGFCGSGALGIMGADAPFDLILIDPPYEQELAEAALTHLIASALIAEDALVIVEESRYVAFSIPDGLVLDAQKQYGDTSVYVLRAASVIHRQAPYGNRRKVRILRALANAS